MTILIGLTVFVIWLLYLGVTGVRLARLSDQVATPVGGEAPMPVN